jgi:hypothetical protein
MKKTPIYDLYCEVTERGTISDSSKSFGGICGLLKKEGLDCSSFEDVMGPTEEHLIVLRIEGEPIIWFGGPFYELTSLRENLMLLWACYNGEEF